MRVRLGNKVGDTEECFTDTSGVLWYKVVYADIVGLGGITWITEDRYKQCLIEDW